MATRTSLNSLIRLFTNIFETATSILDAHFLHFYDGTTIKKITWANVKVAIGAEVATNKSTNVTTDGASDTKYPSVKAVKTYADAREVAAKAYADTLVVGLVDDRGNFDASGNAFPSSGGSGTAGAILKGDLWTVSVAGTLGGHPVTAGDLVRALVDTPGSTSANWAITENNIGYVAENSANKDTDSTFAADSDTKYPSQKAVKTANDAKLDKDISTLDPFAAVLPDALIAVKQDAVSRVVRGTCADAGQGLGSNVTIGGLSDSVFVIGVGFDAAGFAANLVTWINANKASIPITDDAVDNFDGTFDITFDAGASANLLPTTTDESSLSFTETAGSDAGTGKVTVAALANAINAILNP